MVIKAIEICESKIIKDRERFWIDAFPYGLNDLVSYIMNNTSFNLSIYQLFNKGGRRWKHLQVNPQLSLFNPEEFMLSLHTLDIVCKDFYLNFVRNKIMSLKGARLRPELFRDMKGSSNFITGICTPKSSIMHRSGEKMN